MLHRRTFFQRSALAFAALHMRGSTTNVADRLIPTRSVPFPGRAFALTPIYDAPNGNPLADGLAVAPDSVHQVINVIGGWYRIDHGWLPASALQPIRSYTRPPILRHADAPCWAEVIAASTPIQQWCDSRAPIIGNFGYGAVVEVLGTLIDDYKAVWYEIAAGWVRALHFAPIALSDMPSQHSPRLGGRLSVDRGRRLLTWKTESRIVLETYYYGGTDLDQLSNLSEMLIGTLTTDRPGDEAGQPWLMTLAIDHLNTPMRVAGAWDHNRFGLAGGGAAMTIAPDAARMLYEFIANVK